MSQNNKIISCIVEIGWYVNDVLNGYGIEYDIINNSIKRGLWKKDAFVKDKHPSRN